MRYALMLVASLLVTSCLLPEIRIVNRNRPDKAVDPNNHAPQLLSCAGISPNKETPPGPNQVEIAGVQEPGKYGSGRVIARFIVLPDGTVDPGTIEIRESGENIGRGMSTLSPTREMVLEAKSVARTCRYTPAMKEGKPVAYPVVTSFIITRNT